MVRRTLNYSFWIHIFFHLSREAILLSSVYDYIYWQFEFLPPIEYNHSLLPFLVSSGCFKNTEYHVLAEETFISHSSRSLKVEGQGASMIRFWWNFYSWWRESSGFYPFIRPPIPSWGLHAYEFIPP